MIIARQKSAFLVLLAFVVFLLTYYLAPIFFLRINFFYEFKSGYSILYNQLIVGLFSCISVLSLSNKVDFGLKFVNFNWWKVALTVVCIESIPLVVFLILFFSDELYLSSWMLLSLVEILIYHVILSPLVEEVFFRGVIQAFLSPLSSIKFEYRQFSISLPLLISSFLFALIHLQYSFIAIVFVFSLGVFCFHLRAKYRSIVPGIFAHFVFNLLSVFIPKIILVISSN